MFGSTYGDTLLIKDSKAVSGSQNEETGVFEPDPDETPVTIYDGRCDAQDMTDKSAGAMVKGDDGNLKEVRGELELFIEDEQHIDSILPGMTGKLNRGSLELQIVVKAVIRTDGTLIADSL